MVLYSSMPSPASPPVNVVFLFVIGEILSFASLSFSSVFKSVCIDVASCPTVSVSHWSPTISPHGRCCICATSLIHLLATSLLPSTTGQPPCSIVMSLAPDLLMLSFEFYLFSIVELTLMLCQKMAAPSSGLAATPRRGKAVMPPAETF